MKPFLYTAKIVLALTVFCTMSTHAQTPSVDELWKIIQKQQAEIESLKQAATKASSQIKETEVKVAATADAVENTMIASSGSTRSKTSIGGYGELHYNNLKTNEDSPSHKDEIDLHRFVLFFNHEFSDSVRFFSELEVEHSLAGEGKNGEVELEQAFIEFDINENHKAKAGLFLLPVGLINETHEPNTFYGVERNNVEKNIIPTTWWEAGAGLAGELFTPGLSYDFAVHSGLESWNGTTFRGVRSGRKKVSEAPADDFAYTGRIKYTGITGLELAATLQHQNDLMQGESFSTIGGEVKGLSANLLELHAAYQTGPFSVRALYAQWNINDDVENLPSGSGADKQVGWYFEPSVKVNDKLGFFTRYSFWDTNAGDNSDSRYHQADIGVNYWLTPEVALKADYQVVDAASKSNETRGFNLGVGWAF
ncbi:MAG: OprO/OprP family phosphate-selective porin [Cellvibrionaceae bacterium]